MEFPFFFKLLFCLSIKLISPNEIKIEHFSVVKLIANLLMETNSISDSFSILHQPNALKFSKLSKSFNAFCELLIRIQENGSISALCYSPKCNHKSISASTDQSRPSIFHHSEHTKPSIQTDILHFQRLTIYLTSQIFKH